MENTKLISVHGFVMVRNLNDGCKYKITERVDPKYGMVYDVRKPLGKKVIVTHYKSTIDLWISDDVNRINRIEIIL